MRKFWYIGQFVFCILWALSSMSAIGQGGNQDSQLYSDNCAICHGTDGKGTDRGSAIATLPNVISKSDAELLGVLHNGTSGGMPAFPQFTDQEAQTLVKFLRRLQALTEGASAGIKPSGDTNAGRVLFFGKGHCSSCHMINGEGGFIASDMTAYAQSRNAASILQSILKPDAPLAPASQVVEVETRTGKKISGVARAEDNLELTLQSQDGQYHFLRRDGLEKVTYSGRSLMPRDYGTRLTAKELNDLVSYLVITAKNAPPEPAPAHRRGGRDQ